ncbi:GtrA family protein [Janthinobacterium agaricidamnosum]|uniref:GtrA-like family protein n=1 Tax=Janthinobacterium agaricidamnosum NBRC 102515 = DSM 9628 TaxID=1349767 RepID=W0V840_9BURK|nr:GtrA family protein [Janthinobacterium agaricidamnosum]CDG84051.1 gtrA-like family protein [Janthinobacterium agaricidamnosum NBRC 102515 = DSM 9628]
MSVSRQFLRFAAVGASGTTVQYGVLWTGVELLGTSAAAASGLGYVLGSVVNYILNYFFTFKSDKGHGEAATKYFTLLGIGWCMNTGLMWLLVHQLGWNYWIAQVLATGIGLAWNFLGSRWWAFKLAGAQD